jgi:hypothetical protein
MGPALQTPITRETLDAFQNPPLIQNQHQAAIAALRKLGTTRLEYDQSPKVISATRMSNQEAMKIIGDSGFTAGNYEVWLVVFEGDFCILPPRSAITPGGFGHNCVWVVISIANDQGEAVKSAPCGKN